MIIIPSGIMLLLLQQSPERDANGRPIRKSRRQSVDLKVLLADDDDSDDGDYAYTSKDEETDDDEDDSDDGKKDDPNHKQSGDMDNPNPSSKDLTDSNISAETDSKLFDSIALDTEPPKKRSRIEAKNEDGQVVSKASETDNNGANDKATDDISPRSRHRRALTRKVDDDDDDDEVEKWAKAIIRYNQQTEDIRNRYVGCCLCKYSFIPSSLNKKLQYICR